VAEKPWNRNHGYGRRKASRAIRDTILIVCEGEKTEPNYFMAFPVKKEVVAVRVEGAGANTKSLVQEAIRIKESAKRRSEPFNQVWCVFDRDLFLPETFNEAFRLAEANQIRTAYSNQCFELWYFLHFAFLDTALHRHEYGKRLTGLLAREYRKNDEGMYKDLLPRQQDAVRNAKRLLTRYAPCCPERDDPSTTVHLLVEELNKFC
jgi:hypothetical protein